VLRIVYVVWRHQPPVPVVFVAPNAVAAPRWEDLDSEIELLYPIDLMYMVVENRQTIFSHN
jgi:hypothetical protein